MKPIVRKVVEEIQNSLTAQPNTESTIYNIYGITGIGKSYILRTLLDKQPALLFNFDTDKPMDREKRSSFAAALEEVRSTYSASAITFPDPTNISDLEVYTQHVGDPSQPPRLILFDGVDDVPYWKEIQRCLIKPLTTPRAEGAPINVIVASQSPIFWHYWELREMVELIEIPPFELDETRQFLKENYPSYAGLSEDFHNFTGGYPLALEELLTIIDGGLSAADQARLKEAIETHKELGWIGLLRRTDPASLEIVLHAADPNDERWREEPKLGFNEQIQLLRQQLWDAGYSLPLSPQQRAWLKEHQLARYPEAYRRVLGALVIHYEERISKRDYPQLHRHTFNEWLYFHLCLKEVPQADNNVWINYAIKREPLIQDVHNDTELLDLMSSSSDQAAYIALLPELRDRLEPLISPETRQAYIDRLTERLEDALGYLNLGPETELRDVLRAAYEAEDAEGKSDGFKLTELKSQLPSKQSNLERGNVGDIVLILNSRSFILYEAQSQQFRLNNVLRSFVSTVKQAQSALPLPDQHAATQ